MELSNSFHLLLLLCSLNVVALACPNGCQCSENKIRCNDISEFPTALPSSTNSLYISKGNIYSFKPQDFADFANALALFVVKDGVLREVRPGTFDSTPNLGALAFTGTELQDLPGALFQNLARLEYLTLSSNQLLVLRPGWFSSLSALKALDLSKNLFTSVPVETFRPLSELQSLMLAGNNISQLAGDTFKGLSHLKTLRLNKNSLQQIPAGAFDELVNLEELSLQDNLISYLHPDTFSKTPKLQKLFISHNRLTALPQGLFLSLPGLSQISLYENQLESLSPGVFGPMPMEQLWLYDNKLSRLEDDTFRNLTNVNLLVLSRNQISYVSPWAFRGMENLREVSLHTNLLTKLEAGTFRGLPNLVNISLEHNLIHTLPLGFLQGVSQLGQIDLRNNSLSSLPQAILDELNVTREVLLHRNPWRCDRDILPLRDWLRQHPSKANHSLVVCDTPLDLNGGEIADLTDDALPPLGSTGEPTVIPTDKRRKPSTPPPKRSTVSPAVEATPTAEKGEDTSSGHGEEGAVSRNTQIIIIAVVCTAIISSIIIGLVCWRKNKRESRNLGRRSKNSVL